VRHGLHVTAENSVDEHQNMIPCRTATIESSFEMLKGKTTGACSRTTREPLHDLLESFVSEE
jgi:hypothetical protein